MSIISAKNIVFSYGQEKPILNNIDININEGEFVLIAGKVASGKSTLLKLLRNGINKNEFSSGEIYFNGKDLNDMSSRDRAENIAYIMQNANDQIVTDRVYKELCFSMECLGYDNQKMHNTIAEVSQYFGISDLYNAKTNELSGGQKQILNLASCMTLDPKVIILDEPTSQLDPISASNFINWLSLINKELNKTIIIVEHRLDSLLGIASRVILLDQGQKIADTKPCDLLKVINSKKDMLEIMPSIVKIFSNLNCQTLPLTASEGRVKLEELAKKIKFNHIEELPSIANQKVAIELKDCYFRYEKLTRDILSGCDLKVYEGEIFSIIGGNGSGKSTLAKLISGIISPYRGWLRYQNLSYKKIKNINIGKINMLFQDPKTILTEDTVENELLNMCGTQDDKAKINGMMCKMKISHLAKCHPYDLSGGEIQKVALAKILLTGAKVIILDEPTKSLDNIAKRELKSLLNMLKLSGITVVIVSHDLEFVAEISDRVGMLFNGQISNTSTPKKMFTMLNHYTTPTRIMAKGIIDNAINYTDIVRDYSNEK